MWKLTFDVDGEERVRMMSRRTPQRVASRMVAQALSFEYKVRKCRITLKSIKPEEIVD
jgi:hypothetical protein